MNTAGTNNGKDVIYIDVEDEITSIIDKVRGSQQKIVALVLPKRASVLQSIVNMKLLKRSADEAKKNLVLITSEAGLMPLAGTVGLHVAKSLQSRPEVPDGPGRFENKPEMVDEDEPADEAPLSAPIDKTKTVGELAGAAVMDQEADDAEDTIELGDEDEPGDDETPVVDMGKPKKGSDKKLRVPNFNKFRLLLILGGVLLVGLIIALYVCLKVLPKAHIVIKTDSSAITSNTNLVLKIDPATTLDTKSGRMLASIQQTQKTQSQQVPATGQQNNGTKATGNIKFYNCNQADTLAGTMHTIPAGTGVTANGHTFITNQDVIVPPSHFTGGGACKSDLPSSTIGMTAQVAGTASNQSATNYSVAGYSSITGVGTDTTGGTDNITKIVTQADIDSAKQKITAQETDPIKQALKSSLIAKGLYAVDATFNAGTPDVKTSANVGDTADTLTVTEVTAYTMFGVHESDLQKIVASDVNTKIDPSKQSILDYGLANPVITVQSQDQNGATATMQATVIAGPDLKVGPIIQAVAGKKAGDATAVIKANPGVTDVTVTYSPFWVSSIPKNASKITVVIDKPTTTTTTNANAKP